MASPLRFAGVACLALSMVSIAGPRVAWAEPPADFDAHLDEGNRLFADGKAADAAAEFTAAYRSLDDDDQVGQAGEYAVALANDAYLEAGSDPDSLRANRDLLRSYIDQLDAARAEGRPVESGEMMEQQLRERLAELDQMLAEPAPTASTEDGPGPSPRPRPEPLGPLGPLDIGLLVGGSVALAGGLALTIQGGRFPGLIDEAKQQALATYSVDPGEIPASWNDHEQRQRRRGRAMLASGITVIVLGAGALAWGAVRLATKRTSGGRHAHIEPHAGTLVVTF